MARTDRGSVRYHRGGWELRIQIDGRRVTRRHAGPDTRAGRVAAERALDGLIAQLTASGDQMTVAAALEAYRATNQHRWKPSTREKTPGHIAAVNALLGDHPLDRLTVATIEDAWAAALADGRAPSTIRRWHAVLSAALSHAVRRGAIAHNPARDVEHDRIRRRPLDHLPDLPTALAAVRGLENQRIRSIALVALGTGARRGELAALRWSDLDLDAGVVGIHEAISGGERSDTKAGPGRTITIDPATVTVLREWRPAARRHALALGSRIGPRAPVWCADTDPSAPWDPNAISRAWGTAKRRAGLHQVRFHDLRHIHATHLLRSGVPAHVVARRLGHASAKMTLDVYAHALPADDALAAEIIARAQA